MLSIKITDNLISGPFSSLLTSISIMNHQIMMSTQFTEEECEIWKKSMSIYLEKEQSSIYIHSISESTAQSSNYLLNELRKSTIVSAIISFTSSFEYYLKEIIELSLQRNSSLRKKAFSKLEISALELEKDIELNEIKKRTFRIISADKSKGQLFSEKMKRASTFLAIPDIRGAKNLFHTLDSIWKLRNEFAHTNTNFNRTYEINTLKKNLLLKPESTKEEYLKFTFELINIFNTFLYYMEEWDKSVLDKWEANDFVH
ncbi:HEPN domain-containing protein [Jejuia spongiicola]|uniref:HEPN domain-containing protein n=1 Tax=Jejuia spongiicola TaxID=2942207 RepID=A0ABT0QFY0_9FLAO|nr:HEPN domain-containing protein [Jejuia spongiicola]MCL6295882.1 HEPN domain-containing protein [Jejuia spongiicola]